MLLLYNEKCRQLSAFVCENIIKLNKQNNYICKCADYKPESMD